MNNLLAVLRRIFAKHILYHMAIPLVVGALFEFVYTKMSKSISFGQAVSEMTASQHIVPVLGVLVAYLVVMYFILSRETESVPYNPYNIGAVDDHLSEATGYFAVNQVHLRDWLTPGGFRYYSLLLRKKRRVEEAGKAFQYQRVMIFASEREYNDALTQALDRPHAWALAQSHRDFRIPLSYIKPEEFRTLLDAIPQDDRAAFLKPQAWPKWLIKLIGYRRCTWMFHFDFALIERPGGDIVLLAPTGKENVRIVRDQRVKVYEQLIDKIKDIVHSEGRVRGDHEFRKLLEEV